MGDTKYDITDLSPRHQAIFLRGIRGGDGSDPPTDPPAPPPPPAPPEKTFSQADVDRIAAREKSEGKRHALREFAEANGMTVDEVEAAIKAQADAAAANQSEIQKAQQKADREAAQRTAAEQERDQAKFDRRVDLALIKAGAPIESLDRIRRLVTVSDFEADDATVEADITTIKTQWPALFEALPPSNDPPPPGTPPAPPHSDPGRPPAPQGPKGDEEKRAHDLLLSRHPRLAQK